MPLPAAPANFPVPPLTVKVPVDVYVAEFDIDWDSQTLPVNDVWRLFPLAATTVLVPDAWLLPAVQGGGVPAADCMPLVVPRRIGEPLIRPAEFVTFSEVDTIVPTTRSL